MYASKYINPATVKAAPFGKGVALHNTGFKMPKSEPYTYARGIAIQRNDPYFNFPNSLAPKNGGGQVW